MQDDAIWVVQAKEGNQQAFRALYDANVAPLYRFLRQFSSSDDQVSEWVQRSFVKAFERLETFNEQARFSSWLFSVALNEMKMDWRRANYVSYVADIEELDSTSSDSQEFEWDVAMKSLIQSLDETKRAVFILYEVEGYSHAEIASMLGIAESSSRTFLTRAKRFLQDRWNQENSQ